MSVEFDGERIRIRGTVQGVGFRPAVARVARRLGLRGYVRNDADGVEIGLVGPADETSAFLDAFMSELPPLARVDEVHRTPAADLGVFDGFSIVASEGGAPRTDVPPDAAMCDACWDEVRAPGGRRSGYPFTTCTHCGPRFSIATRIPFDRDATTMVRFPLCEACAVEYSDDGDRRFHAQAVACPVCGPRLWVESPSGLTVPDGDPIRAVAQLLAQGHVVAVKGLGGFHLCVDATNPDAVARLRARKRRPAKPFALMAVGLEAIERYVHVAPAERVALESAEAPIVLLERRDVDDGRVGVAPGQTTLGFMLPYTPLHKLLMEELPFVIVCTSGNRSEEPQCIDDDAAREQLSAIADAFLFHDRPIRNRVDDSVVRFTAGAARAVRRARGYAPTSVRLPPGFEGAPKVFAAGPHLKATFCLADDRRAVLSPHLGDLDDVRAFDAYQDTFALMSDLYRHEPELVAVDLHPGYRATQWAQEAFEGRDLPIVGVQHHHAHVAAVLAEHGVPRDAPPVWGLTLDGLGMGLDGELWGGELLRVTYADFERQGRLPPTPLLGGDAAAREPWRNLYAHLRSHFSWAELEARFGELSAVAKLKARPRAVLDRMLATGMASPPSSSAGRLFDAVAAAADLQDGATDYEGQAAIELEAALADEAVDDRRPYELTVETVDGLLQLGLAGMWAELLDDLRSGASTAVVSGRFHAGLAQGLVRLVDSARAREAELDTVVLAGGCFLNRRLLETVTSGLKERGLRVLLPERFPTNDGSIALGQAVVAAARAIEGRRDSMASTAGGPTR